MNNSTQDRLLRAIYATLRPLVRLLIRFGITYGQFADISKLAYVQEALREKDDRGRKINASRVSVKTGISRKEVRRIRELKTPVAESSVWVDGSAVPAQLLHLWFTDPKYVDANGNPRSLPLVGGTPNLTELVRSVSGDVPVGAIRAELEQSGAMEESSDGMFRALKQYYVPGDFDEKALTAIVGSLYTLAATTEHNANPERVSDGFIQRFAYSNDLTPEAADQFQRWSRIQATDFIESMDRWLGARETTKLTGRERTTGEVVGIGVYFYRGPSAEDTIAENVTPGAD